MRHFPNGCQIAMLNSMGMNARRMLERIRATFPLWLFVAYSVARNRFDCKATLCHTIFADYTPPTPFREFMIFLCSLWSLNESLLRCRILVVHFRNSYFMTIAPLLLFDFNFHDQGANHVYANMCARVPVTIRLIVCCTWEYTIPRTHTHVSNTFISFAMRAHDAIA